MTSPETPKKARTLRWNLRSTPQRTKEIPWDLRPAARPNPQTDILTPPTTPRRRRVQRSTKPTTQRPKRRESGRAKERRNNAPRGLIRADALGQILPGAVATQSSRSFLFVADEDCPAQTRSITFTPAPATPIPLGEPTPPGTPRPLQQEEPPLLDQKGAAENERFMVGVLASKARTFENESGAARRLLEHIDRQLALARQFDHDDILATDTMDGVETNTIRYGEEGTELVDEDEPPSRELRGGLVSDHRILQRTDSELARLPPDIQNETSTTEERTLSEQVPAVGVPVSENQAGVMVHNESGLETGEETIPVIMEDEAAGIKRSLKANGEFVMRGAMDNPHLRDFIQQSNELSNFLPGQPFDNSGISGQLVMAPPPHSNTAPDSSLMAGFDNLGSLTAESWPRYSQGFEAGVPSAHLDMNTNMMPMGQHGYQAPFMPALDTYGIPLAGSQSFVPQAAQFNDTLAVNDGIPTNGTVHSGLVWGQDLLQAALAPDASTGATNTPFGHYQDTSNPLEYYGTSYVGETRDDRSNTFVEGCSRDGQGFRF